MSGREAVGAVLAGGRGSRLGGAKATADLAGHPLISYPLAALAAAGLEAFVVAKLDAAGLDASVVAEPAVARLDASVVAKPATALGVHRYSPATAPAPAPGTGAPEASLVEVVVEPEEPVHPLVGIVAALRHAGRPLVVLGCDFPFVPPDLLRALADAREPLVVPAPGGAIQPLVARWTPVLLPPLEAALAREEPLRRTVATLAPHLLGADDLAPFGDPSRTFFNVNTGEDLRAAAALL